MKILASGNPIQGIAKSLALVLDNIDFASRTNGFDLTKAEDQKKFADKAKDYDVVIINSALWKFNQTVLLDVVYKTLLEAKKPAHIVVIGSTTDRVKNGKAWLYNAEKKALRDYSNTLSISSVWGAAPKVSYISFGTLSNNQEKHPDRKCMNIINAAEYIKWLINQPKNVNINEISIDPMQHEIWHS
jgi:hypothetical protein